MSQEEGRALLQEARLPRVPDRDARGRHPDPPERLGQILSLADTADLLQKGLHRLLPVVRSLRRVAVYLSLRDNMEMIATANKQEIRLGTRVKSPGDGSDDSSPRRSPLDGRLLSIPAESLTR